MVDFPLFVFSPLWVSFVVFRVAFFCKSSSCVQAQLFCYISRFVFEVLLSRAFCCNSIKCCRYMLRSSAPHSADLLCDVSTFFVHLADLIYPFFYPFVPTQASVKQPLLVPESNLNKDGRLPVIIFSHGMWACRTTYTATCIDVASYGYS